MDDTGLFFTFTFRTFLRLGFQVARLRRPWKHGCGVINPFCSSTSVWRKRLKNMNVSFGRHGNFCRPRTIYLERCATVGPPTTLMPQFPVSGAFQTCHRQARGCIL